MLLKTFQDCRQESVSYLLDEAFLDIEAYFSELFTVKWQVLTNQNTAFHSYLPITDQRPVPNASTRRHVGIRGFRNFAYGYVRTRVSPRPHIRTEPEIRFLTGRSLS